MSKLTPKQEGFCLAYIETGNASEAYRRAYDAGGMADNTRWVAASRLLANPKVKLRLEALQEDHRAAHKVTVSTLNAHIDQLIDAAKVRANAGNAQALNAWYKAIELRAKIFGLYDPPPAIDEQDTRPDVIEVRVVNARVPRDENGERITLEGEP